MRATRGLWAAVGAGTSLAAAGVLALFVLSVALAVHGWPQVGGSGDPRAVELRAAALRSADEVSGAAAAPGRSQVVLAARVTRTPRAVARRRAASGRRVPSRTPRRPGSAVSSPQSPASAASPAPAPGPVAQLPQAAGQVVQQATGAAGGVVRPVSPAAAGTVTQAGTQAGGAVDAPGKAVGGLVGGLAGGGR
jgi:hypothetical protein